MARRDVRDYTCQVVHEQVRIYLRPQKQRFDARGPKTHFVQCNQDDCQYVDKNELPCPLDTRMFDEGIEEKEVPHHDDGESLCRW